MKGTIVQGSRGGRYAIHSTAGEGGAGTVYQAKDVSTGKIVALKVLHSKRFELNDIQRERFLNEIRASMDVSSEYIVTGIDSGEHNGAPFLVMEWLSGGTLKQLIQSGDYNTEDLIAFTAQLLLAYRDLQRLGLVHRDLKPNNILLTAHRRLKLSDLGLVRSAAAPAYLTADDARIGSLLYISERQRFRSKEVTCRDDFFSLCLILYELVSRSLIHTRNVPLQFIRPAIAPVALCAFVDQGMQDLDDWQDTHHELCQYIDLERECINPDYTGSVIVPEHTIQAKVDHLRAHVGRDSQATEIIETKTESTIVALQEIAYLVSSAFNDCAREFKHCGVAVEIVEVLQDGDTLYFSASFRAELDVLLDRTNLDELAHEGLYGWIAFETHGDGSVQIHAIHGKRLFVDGQYLPEDTFDRIITVLDDETKMFLRHVSRAVAVGAGIGAIERIEALLE